MWKNQVVQRRQSTAELHAKQLLDKPLSSSTNSDGALAKVQAMTIQFQRQRERKRRHGRSRVKKLTHRPLSAVHHTGNPSFRLAVLMANDGTTDDGFDIQRDDEHSAILFKQAAAIGHTGSMVALGEFYQAGRSRDPKGLTLDRPKMTKALGSFKMASKQGDPHAALRTGICLEATDMWEARRYYLMAAKHGLADAQYNLGMLDQTLANWKESRTMLLLAAKQNHVGALNNLGWMYMEGRGCQKDVVRAKNYFIKASNGGDAFGCANMGLLEIGRAHV